MEELNELFNIEVDSFQKKAKVGSFLVFSQRKRLRSGALSGTSLSCNARSFSSRKATKCKNKQ